MALDDVLQAVPALRGGSAEPLSGGLTNTNYKVTSPVGAFVVRIAGRDTGLLAIDRENEVYNTIAASETGVGATFVAALPEHDALVLEFLEGEVMDAATLRRGDRLPAIADACRRLHAGRRFLRDFDMFDVQRRYLDVVRERGFRLPRRYLELEPAVRRLEDALRARPEQTVPCNNDLLAENFIDVGGTMRLIDYEYSGNNEPSFELGNVWSESNLSLDQLEELVARYYGVASRAKVARARLWGLIAKYGWTLWGSIQQSVSEIEFDFWEWAMEKYERALEEFDGPDYDALLLDAANGD
ncbi:MAG TPA: choline/ethanolamine kinase family protein [Gaiellaceae bacterium]|nr:choline/ethanolamine kinase family protein [Gaiellaceae bacterium]